MLHFFVQRQGYRSYEIRGDCAKVRDTGLYFALHFEILTGSYGVHVE